MSIPDRETCLNMMRESGMLSHILRHSELVARVALLLARELVKTGVKLNVALVEAGALLHDITKTQALSTGERHAQSGEAALLEQGFPEVARVVGQHVRLRPEYNREGTVTEEELVYYADKRVMHESIVSLEERYRDLGARYARKPEHQKLLADALAAAVKVEEKLFAPLSFGPEDLEGKLDEAA